MYGQPQPPSLEQAAPPMNRPAPTPAAPPINTLLRLLPPRSPPSSVCCTSPACASKLPGPGSNATKGAIGSMRTTRLKGCLFPGQLRRCTSFVGSRGSDRKTEQQHRPDCYRGRGPYPRCHDHLLFKTREFTSVFPTLSFTHRMREQTGNRLNGLPTHLPRVKSSSRAVPSRVRASVFRTSHRPR